MRTNWNTLLAAAVLSLGLALPTLTVAQPGQEGGQQGGKRERERHPEIREAMRQLRHTKEILQKEAAHDFQGHRVKAIEHIDQALGELERALESDRR